MAEEEILQDIERLEARLQFLEGDRTRWVMPWAGDPGYQPYDHGPLLEKAREAQAPCQT